MINRIPCKCFFGMKFIKIDQKTRNGSIEPRHSYAFSGRA